MESSWETGLRAPGLRSTRQTGRPCLLVEPPGSAVQLSGILSACHPLLVATLKCAKVATWN